MDGQGHSVGPGSAGGAMNGSSTAASGRRKSLRWILGAVVIVAVAAGLVYLLRTPSRGELLLRLDELKREIEGRSSTLDHLCAVAGVRPDLLRDPSWARLHLQTNRQFDSGQFKDGKISEFELEQRTMRSNALESAIKERERLAQLLEEAAALKEQLDRLPQRPGQDSEREYRRQLNEERERDWRRNSPR